MSAAAIRARAPRQVLLALMLAGVTAAVASGAGAHAHGPDASAGAGPCVACALGHQPALAAPACLGPAPVAPLQTPVLQVAERPRAFVLARPRLGRAPPAC